MKYILIVIGCLLLATASLFSGQTAEIVMLIDTPDLAWSETNLGHEIQLQLSRKGSMNVAGADQLDPELPPCPLASHNLDSLVLWGEETGRRYILSVEVSSERLERRKTFSLPLVFSRWETVGVIDGELRMIDVSKKRILVAEPFEIVEKAKRIFQMSFEGSEHDPDIILSPMQKIELFKHLEKTLAEHVYKKVKRYTRRG